MVHIVMGLVARRFPGSRWGLNGLNGGQGMPVKVLYLYCNVLGSAEVGQLQAF